MKTQKSNLIIAFVGMPGSGKSEATSYLKNKGIPFVRFGDVTDEEVEAMGLPLNQENERMVREKLRQEHGMAVYALRSKPKIEKLLDDHDVIAIDGLYSWEEYTYLLEEFPNLLLIHIFMERGKRYERLSQRPVRPLTYEESLARDIAEVGKLNKAGPIAMADYLIENDSDIPGLRQKIDQLLKRLGVEIVL